MNNNLQKYTSHGLYHAHILYLKVRTIIVWAEKTVQNRALKITETNKQKLQQNISDI